MPNKNTRSNLKRHRRQTKRRNVERPRPHPWKLSWIEASPFANLSSAKKAETAWKKGGQPAVGFTATSSLKSMGRIPRSHGKYEVGDKYKAIR